MGLGSTAGSSTINIGSIMEWVGLELHNYRDTDISGWVPDKFFHEFFQTGGVVNLTRFFASHFGSRRIRCNGFHPGGRLNEGIPRPLEKLRQADLSQPAG